MAGDRAVEFAGTTFKVMQGVDALAQMCITDEANPGCHLRSHISFDFLPTLLIVRYCNVMLP